MGKYKSLSEEMVDLARFEVENAAGGDRSFPVVYLYGDEGIIVCALADCPPGPELARMARMLVYQQEPEIAIISLEGWTARRDLPQEDPDYRRLIFGELTPSQLPPEKRGEILMLYGESAVGESIYRGWYIDSHDGKRTLSELETSEEVHSRFEPLFLVDALLRSLESGRFNGSPLPDSMLKGLRLSSKYMTPRELRESMRKVVGNMLIQGGGTSSRTWVDTDTRIRRAARDKIMEDWSPPN